MFDSQRDSDCQAYFLGGIRIPFLTYFDQCKTLTANKNAYQEQGRLVQERKAAWRAQGLNVLFLPPYCPHLNRIEVLWKQVKYRWLEPHAYADFETLCQRVTTILEQCPAKYPISFV